MKRGCLLAVVIGLGTACGAEDGSDGDSDVDVDMDVDTDTDVDTDVDTDGDAEVRWRIVYDEDDLDAWVISAWGPSPDLVYFVGGTNDSSLVLRWDGTSFERIELDLGARLWWACGTGPDDIWVVGERGVSAWWNGETWTSLPSLEGDPTLWGCWAPAADDVWAVGERSLGMGGGDAIPRRVLRSTGAGAPWTLFEAPEGSLSNLFKMWGAAWDDAWIVGEFGTMMHWNGATLENVDPGGEFRMVTVHGVDADEVYVVGGGSPLCANGTFLSGGGRGWTVLKNGCDNEAPDPWPALNGVSIDPDGTVFVAGIRGFLAQGSPDAMEVQEALTDRDFHAVFAGGVDDAWAMGGNMQTSSGDPVGVLLHYGPRVVPNPL